MWDEFLAYRACDGHRIFSVGSSFWRPNQKPYQAWQRAKIQGSKLAVVALRLFGTIANSVPSERSFSTQNFLHSNVRNRITTERTDKMAFIYINSRVLKRVNGMTEASERGPLCWEQASESDLMHLEDQLAHDEVEEVELPLQD